MKKVKLEIVGMSYSQSQTGAYALILGIPGQKKRLPIIIGSNEAQSIAIELEKMKPSRPLTHDLFKNFAAKYKITINEVLISKFEEGIFHSILVCERDGIITEIDSRTSDAVALALRFECPIYVYQKIIDEAGIMLEDRPLGDDPEAKDVENEPKDPTSGFSSYLFEELQDMLKAAIENENYEEASKIRDEINNRKQN
ncbi:MAG: bifunctional nuclease family protein [Bacteroidota bacterium]